MTEQSNEQGVFRTGLDAIDNYLIPDGIPLYSLNVIGGAPGTGKTILALQMAFANARPDNRVAYFTTISEPSVKFLSYLQQFDFYDDEVMKHSIIVRDIGEAIQTKPLEEVIEMVNIVISEEDIRLVIIDSFKAISDIVPQADQLRIFAYNLAVNLLSSLTTAFVVGEYTPEDVSNVPIFAIADGIIFLSFRAENLNRQRYLEIHKIRGRRFFAGQHPFLITSQGISSYPRIRTPDIFQEHDFPRDRVSTGIKILDDMLSGGLPRSSATMVAGGAGTGKTLLGLSFIMAGIEKGEPGTIVSFQENPMQLRRIASSFNWDLNAYVEQGLLIQDYQSPVEIQPDIHIDIVKRAVERVDAKRVLIDSLKDLEIATPDKVRFRDYVYSMVDGFKRQGITVLLTNEIPELFGVFQLSEFGTSFIADNVILLRYVELAGQVGRLLNVLKVRGSQHSKDIREFTISEDGMVIGKSLDAVTGVLVGSPTMRNAYNANMMLSQRTRFVFGIVQQSGAVSGAELLTITGLTDQTLHEELSTLLQQGLIIKQNHDSTTRYSASY